MRLFGYEPKIKHFKEWGVDVLTGSEAKLTKYQYYKSQGLAFAKRFLWVVWD